MNTKNNSSKKLKPIYTHDLHASKSDEINFIDITIMLIKHKLMIAIILVINIIIGVIFTLQKPTIYTYSTSIEIGSQIINGTTTPLESAETLLAKLNYSFIPQVINDQHPPATKEKKKGSYNIEPVIPKNSMIIVLTAKVKNEQENTIINILNSITKKTIQDHKRIFQSVKINLKTKLNQAITDLKRLKKEKDNEAEIIINQSIIESLETQLRNLRNTRQIQPPIQISTSTNNNRTIIIIASAFSGLFLGIFAAFFTEFLSKVKQKIATSKA